MDRCEQRCLDRGDIESERDRQWTSFSAALWITITRRAAGSGNGTVGYIVAANTATSARIGIATIAGRAFTVTQAGIRQRAHRAT